MEHALPLWPLNLILLFILTIQARSHHFSWPLPSSPQTLATSCCSWCLLIWTFMFLSPKTWVPPHSPLDKIQILSLALCVRIPSQATFWVLPLVISLSFLMLTAHAPVSHKSLSFPVPLLTLAHVSRACLSKNTGFTDPQHCSYSPVSQHCTSHVPKSDLGLFYIFHMSFYPFEHTENRYNNFLMFLFAIFSMSFLNHFNWLICNVFLPFACLIIFFTLLRSSRHLALCKFKVH